MIENVEALRPEDARSNRRFERLSIVKKHFGDVPLSAISATAIVDFQCARHDAGIANRTINMDVGVLSRVLTFCGWWRALADHVDNLPERQRPIGRALTAEERRRLFDCDTVLTRHGSALTDPVDRRLLRVPRSARHKQVILASADVHSSRAEEMHHSARSARTGSIVIARRAGT